MHQKPYFAKSTFEQLMQASFLNILIYVAPENGLVIQSYIYSHLPHRKAEGVGREVLHGGGWGWS